MILRVVLPAVCLAGLFLLAACEDSHDYENCWVGVDSLYVSGNPVAGESSIRDVFARYVAYVDTTDTTFPEDASQVIYISARYDWKWEGTRYWKIHYQAFVPSTNRWLDREILDIDENGVLVKALGCI